MRLKLDENIDARLAAPLRQAGHETMTVLDQGLHSIPDPALYDHCASEGYALVTLDLDFSNVLRYPPETPRLGFSQGGCLAPPSASQRAMVYAIAYRAKGLFRSSHLQRNCHPPFGGTRGQCGLVLPVFHWLIRLRL